MGERERARERRGRKVEWGRERAKERAFMLFYHDIEFMNGVIFGVFARI